MTNSHSRKTEKAIQVLLVSAGRPENLAGLFANFWDEDIGQYVVPVICDGCGNPFEELLSVVMWFCEAGGFLRCIRCDEGAEDGSGITSFWTEVKRFD